MELLIQFLIYGVPLLLAIPLHEAAHGWMALRCGDDTAERLGRVTFKPWVHVDPFGTIILPGMLIISGVPIVFGWAKPVPVNFQNLHNPRWDSLKVAIAGPGMNLLLALASVFIWKFAQVMAWDSKILVDMLIFSLLINLALMVFNLLPILPMDGGRVLQSLLPAPLARQYAKTEPYGMIVVMALIFVPFLLQYVSDWDISFIRWVLAPAVLGIADALITFVQIHG